MVILNSTYLVEEAVKTMNIEDEDKPEDEPEGEPENEEDGQIFV